MQPLIVIESVVMPLASLNVAVPVTVGPVPSAVIVAAAILLPPAVPEAPVVPELPVVMPAAPVPDEPALLLSLFLHAASARTHAAMSHTLCPILIVASPSAGSFRNVNVAHSSHVRGRDTTPGRGRIGHGRARRCLLPQLSSDRSA